MNRTDLDLKKQKYIERMTYIKGRSALHKLLQWGNLIFSGIVYVAYPLLLIGLLIQKNPILYRTIIVPLDSFIILSVARYFINRKRPYEVYECEPAIHRDKRKFLSQQACVLCVCDCHNLCGRWLSLSRNSAFSGGDRNRGHSCVLWGTFFQ